MIEGSGLKPGTMGFLKADATAESTSGLVLLCRMVVRLELTAKCGHNYQAKHHCEEQDPGLDK